MHRLWDYLSYAGNVISIPLAIYLYFLTVQERIPVYYVSPDRTRIIDTTIPAPSELRVLYKGKDLRANVSSLIVYFWNDGRLPIKAEDVLESLRIELDPTCEIIDARLLKVSRKVTQFAKGDVSDAAKNSLPISFGILERGDGAAIQIIYTGDPDAAPKLLGVIVGADKVRVIATTQPRRRGTTSSTRIFVACALGSLIVVVVTAMLYRLKRRRRNQQPWGHLDRFYVVGIVLYLAMGAYSAYDTYHKLEPVVPRTIWTGQ